VAKANQPALITRNSYQTVAHFVATNIWGDMTPGTGDTRSYSWTGKPNTLILAVSMNTYGGCSDTGGNGQPGPGVGTGFTNQLKTWASSDCPAIPLATFETMISNATGNINGAFDSSSGRNYYATVAAGFN
jgi:hypothetical protein